MDSGMLSHKQQLLLESVRKLVRRGVPSNLDRLLTKRRPVEIASLFPHLNDWEARNLVTMIVERNVSWGAEMLTEMAPSYAETCLDALSNDQLVAVASSVPADDAALLFRLLPEEQAEELLTRLKGNHSVDVEELLAFPEDSAGGLMITDYFVLPESATVAEAIRALQEAGDRLEMAFYLYITNEAEQLVGVLSLRSLLIKPPATQLGDIMITEILSVHTSTDQEEVARIVARYDLVAVPVLDDYNKLVGIVTVDDVIDVIREEATEDILKMAGAGEEEIGERSTLKSVKTRAPWMLSTLAAGLLAAEIMRHFLPTLRATVMLAGFIPVIVGLSGNAGNQSAGLISRGISVAQVEFRALGRYLFRELKVGLLLGLACGLLLTAFVLFRYSGPVLMGPAVGLAALLAILISVAFGALSPLLLQRLNIDPSFATGPFVSTVVDVLGIGIYFIVASIMLASIPS